MRSGFPSMTALLGVLAIAGYQNRDKIAEMLRDQGLTGSRDPSDPLARSGSTGGRAGGLGGLLAGLKGGLDDMLGGGLNDLDGQMRRTGRADHMDSWVGRGENRAVEPQDLESALGPDVLADLEETTGLTRSEILQRLSRELPRAVDGYTPDGRLPPRPSFG